MMIKGNKPIEVILPPQFPSAFESSKEPQYITSKDPVNGWLYLNSADTVYGVDRTNCQITSDGPFASGFNRLRVAGVSALWYIPNVNPRNNTISFYSSNTGSTKHTVTLTERYYDITSTTDVAALATDIETALNSLTGATLLTFTITAITGFPRKYTISATGGTFHFDLDCTAVIAEQMYNFDRDQTSAASKTLGPMNMMYTQFVDIVSTTLTKWEKIKSISSGDINPIVCRAYIGGNAWGSNFQQLSHYLAFSWNAQEPLYAIDIRMYDQNGKPLYVPNGGKDFMWQITLIAEL